MENNFIVDPNNMPPLPAIQINPLNQAPINIQAPINVQAPIAPIAPIAHAIIAPPVVQPQVNAVAPIAPPANAPIAPPANAPIAPPANAPIAPQAYVPQVVAPVLPIVPRIPAAIIAPPVVQPQVNVAAPNVPQIAQLPADVFAPPLAHHIPAVINPRQMHHVTSPFAANAPLDPPNDSTIKYSARVMEEFRELQDLEQSIKLKKDAIKDINSDKRVVKALAAVAGLGRGILGDYSRKLFLTSKENNNHKLDADDGLLFAAYFIRKTMAAIHAHLDSDIKKLNLDDDTAKMITNRLAVDKQLISTHLVTPMITLSCARIIQSDSAFAAIIHAMMNRSLKDQRLSLCELAKQYDLDRFDLKSVDALLSSRASASLSSSSALLSSSRASAIGLSDVASLPFGSLKRKRGNVAPASKRDLVVAMKAEKYCVNFNLHNVCRYGSSCRYKHERFQS